MRIVATAELKPGDVLEKAVLNHSGIVMLEAGSVLTEHYIQRLKALKIKYVSLSSGPGQSGGELGRKRGEAVIASWERPDIAAMKNDDRPRKEAGRIIGEFVNRGLMLEQIVLPFPEANFRQTFRDIVQEISRQPALAEELGVLLQTDRILFEIKSRNMRRSSRSRTCITHWARRGITGTPMDRRRRSNICRHRAITILIGS